MSATHTHDGPGAIANHSARYFWLAMDYYQPALFNRIVNQLAEPVVDSIRNLQAAKVGHAVGSDTLGLNGYRRNQLNNGRAAERDALRKRIGLVRVDTIDDQPLAVIINYAAHGIAFDVENLYFSGDVLAAVEREVEQQFDTPILAMLVQSAGGDVSPRNVSKPKLQGIERYGRLMAPQVMGIYNSGITLNTAPDIRVVSQRIVLSREALGYETGEFPYEWGAAQCNSEAGVPFVGPGTGENIPYCLPAPPPDAIDLADNGVAENGAFVPQDTRVTAFKIGDALFLAQPGEPLVEQGLNLQDDMMALGVSAENTFIWGYSQDHVGYILPDSEESWNFGDTEGTTSFWGWKQGGRIQRASRELAQALLFEQAAPRDEFTANFALYSDFYDLVPDAQATPAIPLAIATVEPGTIKRFDTTYFTWEGNDPLTELPEIHIEVETSNDNWLPVRRANGEIIDTQYETHLDYRLSLGVHLWTITFEPPLDWPKGNYRFLVNGKNIDSGTSNYQLLSNEFEILTSDSLIISEATESAPGSGTYSATLAYQARPDNYRLIDPSVPATDNAPVGAGIMIFSNGDDVRVVINGTVENNVATYTTDITDIGNGISVIGADFFGNRSPDTAGSDSSSDPDRGSGLLGVLADFFADQSGVIQTFVAGDPEGAGTALNNAITQLASGLGDTLIGDDGSVAAALTAAASGDPTAFQTELGKVLGLHTDPASALTQNTSAARKAEPVVLTGAQLPGWAVPAAQGIAETYPSGVGGDGEPISEPMGLNKRSAHNGQLIYPAPGTEAFVPTGVPVSEIAAFRFDPGHPDADGFGYVEIPVQVDERMPYFLANAESDFSFYSGTDPELTYVWDREAWNASGDGCNAQYPDATPDPIAGIDEDDEIVFMATDAGEMNPSNSFPANWKAVQLIALNDPLLGNLNPNNTGGQRFVYLVQKSEGSSFNRSNGYVKYQRQADADQWIDRGFFGADDPEKLGTSNTGYGANRDGSVCDDGQTVSRQSTDRFPRDGLVVSSDTYRWEATGRWMVRDIRIKQPSEDNPDESYWQSRPDLIDRWKGRAFQQSPDSAVSLVGFEDEQVNWEANSTILGERAGPVRAIREVWGADSGTNVTKTETFYREAITYRYRIRVHPIPPDGLYTSWDYNRSAMVPEAGENVAEGRYFTVLRPQGVPIDGINDEFGQIDDAFGSPAFFDAPDPSFNLALGFENWEQVSGKGDSGSMVYIFELKNAQALVNPLIVPYYRDDACLDDGTGDDPVARPWPGETSTDARVISGYEQASGGTPYDQLRCDQRQGAFGAHGIHYFFTHDSDNAFSPAPVTEIDGQQWQFMVPTDTPQNVAEPYANTVRARLIPVVTPLTPPAVGDAREAAACAPDNADTDSYQHLLGSLHEHSGFSDGTIGTQPASYFTAGQLLALDFMGSSEHSDNDLLPVTTNKDCASERFFECIQPTPDGIQKWSGTLAQADAASDVNFKAFRGFEWTSDRFGHINVFFSANNLNAKTGTGYSLSMEDYWQWFTAPSAIGGGDDGLAVFNHPGREDTVHASSPIGDSAYAWSGMAYRRDADARMVGIEVFGKSGDVYDADNNSPPGGWYAHALDMGWHLGPVGAEDEHGTQWAQPGRAKTVLLADGRSRANLKNAMQGRRFYALAHNNNHVRLSFSADNKPMGSILGVTAGSDLNFSYSVSGVANPTIEIVGPGGNVLERSTNSIDNFTLAVNDSTERWRYMRVLDSSGNIVAYSAPIWFRATDTDYPSCPPDLQPPPEPGDAVASDNSASLLDCALNQNSELCLAALSSLQGLSDCPQDETGLNCAYNAIYDAIGVQTATTLINGLIESCDASPGAELCSAIRSSGNGAVPDRLPLADEVVTRGQVLLGAGAPDSGLTPNFPEPLENATAIGGSWRLFKGEHIYTDYLFDAFGADNGDDARRLAATLLLAQVNSRIERGDQLFQALGQQFGAPVPLGLPDRYGDNYNNEQALDIHEVRWNMDPAAINQLTLKVAFARLQDNQEARFVVFADMDNSKTGDLSRFGLGSSRYDRAIVFTTFGPDASAVVEQIDLTSGETSNLTVDNQFYASVFPDDSPNNRNSMGFSFPIASLLRADNTLKLTVATLGPDSRIANIAYRNEPVAGVYNDREQAIQLFRGNIDSFGISINQSDLTNQITTPYSLSAGYHERQMVSGRNISDEDGSENDNLLQRYGLYIPTAYDGSKPNAMTFWLHYRGGKGHSGAAWTPRLIQQLGEEQNNIVATPHGRGTSHWYVTKSHQDVWEVFADVAGTSISGANNLAYGDNYSNDGLLNIDASRVYLSGYSMGGYGTYLFGLLYPDKFAAGYSTSGATTQGGWTGVDPDRAECRDAPYDIPEVGEGNLCFIQANNSDSNAQLNYRLLENARHFPLVIHHGTNDELVPVTGVERFGLRLQELGYRYDLQLFAGYEHYTQAIVDEWRDGSFYLNKFTRPNNPRQVTYKIVPALVNALNTVNANGVAFNFNPDGAYWIDNITVRNADSANPDQFGQVDITSLAIVEDEVLSVPRIADGNVDNPQDPWLTAQGLSPLGHSTPYVRQGQDWLVIGETAASNGFEGTVTGLASLSLDLSRMGLNFSQPINGKIVSDGAAILTLTKPSADVTACQNGSASNIAADASAPLTLLDGNNAITLLPGLDADCSTVVASNGPYAGERGVTQVAGDFLSALQSAGGSFAASNLQDAFGSLQLAVQGLVDGFYDLVLGNQHASIAANASEFVSEPSPATAEGAAEELLNGYQGTGQVYAGVGVVDMTADVGYCAGQYCDTTDIFDVLSGAAIDPFLTHTIKSKSYGVQSRLTARAIVVEGSNGKRIALLKTDNYLAQDTLLRRIGQILQEQGSSIRHEQILHHVTHNHSAAYSATPSWGVWVFEDVFDGRFFEFQARKMAQAIRTAELTLQPARMGATTTRHKIYKGNIVRPAVADDGSPAGYPLEYNDLGLVVMRFDRQDTQGQWHPLAAWVNWGEHPESLDGHNLHSADYLAPLERFVDRELGVPLVFSQGDVGSAERSGNKNQMLADDGSECGNWPEGLPAPIENNCAFGEGVLRYWSHAGYVQTERNVRFLADDVVDTFNAIGDGIDIQVPLSNDFVVDYRNYRAPGPLSHPYPSVSNCNTETTAKGDFGAPVAGLPDCAREGIPGSNDATTYGYMAYSIAKAEGVPVPDQYDAPAFTAVEENLRIFLQTMRLGEVLLASCACEAQADLILNLESRADKTQNNIYNGFDWACLAEEQDLIPIAAKYAAACALQKQHYFDLGEFPTDIPGDLNNPATLARMRAQIHNDAKGWDAPENAAFAASEAVNPDDIKGNFTKEELPADLGYTLPVGIGHAGDYNGYTVSYREYMNRDHYRKALTAYGPHTADYMVTRLVRMAGAMKGGEELRPEPHDVMAQADELRQQAQAQLIGRTTWAAYEAWQAVIPTDAGDGFAFVEQPQNITRFEAATVRWQGGSTGIDNPLVTVEKRCTNADVFNTEQPQLMRNCNDAGIGNFVTFADMSGEVQTRVHWPEGLEGLGETYASQFPWEWTASFEAYSAFPTRMGSTPAGEYRFRIVGKRKIATGTEPYIRETSSFSVLPWNGIAIENVNVQAGNVSFDIPAIAYPRSYSSPIDFIEERAPGTGGDRACTTCSFRPWATSAPFESATVVLSDNSEILANCSLSARAVSCNAAIGGGTAVAVNAIDRYGNTGRYSIP
jgi:poly(3-hydroxybutyrate) depolymerase